MGSSMSFSVTLLDLAGFAALLLWGIHMVQTGVMRALGPRLKVVLGRALRHPLQGFVAGAAVTTLLQSSTATALMVSGFTAAGLVALVPALAVMLGAISAPPSSFRCCPSMSRRWRRWRSLPGSSCSGAVPVPACATSAG